MGKRKQKTQEEPENKKAAKLNSEEGGIGKTTTQKITEEVVPQKDEKQEVEKGGEDMKEPERTEGNGSESAGKKKKKKNKGSKKNEASGTKDGFVDKKKNEASGTKDGFVDKYVITKEDAETLLVSFSKYELTEVLKSALKKHGDLVSVVADVAHKDSAKRKLFVRGINYDTKPETLRSVFSAYGEVETADIVTDKNTGKSKGFGFVTFKSFAGVMAALKEPNKEIDNRMTICNLSTGAPPSESQEVTGRKIYVGGIPKEDVDSGKLLKLFSQYGEIEEGPLGFDRNSGKSKGYAFFIYKSERSARNALEQPTKILDGVTLTCKMAPAKNNKNGTPSKLAQLNHLQGNMWAYDLPLGGFVPVGNFGSPLGQQAFSKKRRI